MIYTFQCLDIIRTSHQWVSSKVHKKSNKGICALKEAAIQCQPESQRKSRMEQSGALWVLTWPSDNMQIRSLLHFTNCSHCMLGLVKPGDWRRGFWVMLNVFPHMSQLLICQILEKSLSLFSFYIYFHTFVIEMVVHFCDITGWKAIINNNYKFSLGNGKIQSPALFFWGSLHISAYLKPIISPQKAKVCRRTLFTAVCMPDAWHTWGVSVCGIEFLSCGPWAENHFTVCLSDSIAMKIKKSPWFLLDNSLFISGRRK